MSESKFGAGRGSDTEGAGARTPCPTPSAAEERELSYDDQLRLDTTVLPDDGPLVVKLKQIMGERVAPPEEPT